MKYSVVALACVLAVATAQFNNGQYVPDRQYNNYNRYNNRYNPYNRYQQYNNNPYRPFASSTVAPRPSFFFGSTIAPSTIAPPRAISLIKPLQPAAPAPSVAAPAVSVAPSAAPSVAPSTEPSPAPVQSESPAPSVAPAPVRPVISFAAPVAPVAPIVTVPRYVSDSRDAGIIRYDSEINPDGAFNYVFETENGIAAQEEGAPRSIVSGEDAGSAVVAQGSFAWTSPEGQRVAISYVADENGYQPSGDAIPQPPEIPPQIARALEYIARTLPASAVPSK